MGNKHFIMTMDKNIADKLLKNGYTQLDNTDNTYIFINDGKMNFNENPIDMKKVTFTNTLCF